MGGRDGFGKGDVKPFGGGRRLRSTGTPPGYTNDAPSPTKLRLAMAERDVCSRPTGEVHAMKDWLVPPVLFPIFLILLIAVYALLHAPA